MRNSHAAATLSALALAFWTIDLSLDAGGAPHVSIATPASAQDICATPAGYLVFCCPKPCPVFDVSKLAAQADIVTNEISKLNEMISQITEWTNALKAIGSQATGLVSQFLTVGSSLNGLIAGLKDLPQILVGSSTGSSSLNTFSDARSALSSLFYSGGANSSVMAQREATFQDAATATAATGMNGRTVMTTTTDDLNSLASSVSNAKSLREDLAARNAIALNLLQSLQTTTTLFSSQTSLTGLAAMLGLGDQGTSANNPSVNFSTPTSTTTTPLTASSADQAAQAATDVMQAAALHNALVAATEMLQGSAAVQTAIDYYNSWENQVNEAQTAFGQAMSSYYVDPTQAAAKMTAAAPSITAAWVDTYDRTSQEQLATSTVADQAVAAPSDFGAYQCADNFSASCDKGLNAAVNAALQPVLDDQQNANWWKTFADDAASTQQSIAAETASLSASVGVDLSDAAAVKAKIASLLSDAGQNLSSAASDPTMGADTSSRIAAVNATISNLNADSGYQNYISYDPAIPSAPNSSATVN